MRYYLVWNHGNFAKKSHFLESVGAFVVQTLGRRRQQSLSANIQVVQLGSEFAHNLGISQWDLVLVSSGLGNHKSSCLSLTRRGWEAPIFGWWFGRLWSAWCQSCGALRQAHRSKEFHSSIWRLDGNQTGTLPAFGCLVIRWALTVRKHVRVGQGKIQRDLASSGS